MAIDIEATLKSLPPEAETAMRNAGYMEPDLLEVGMSVPRIQLLRLEEDKNVVVGAPGDRPTVLIFGSYT